MPSSVSKHKFGNKLLGISKQFIDYQNKNGLIKYSLTFYYFIGTYFNSVVNKILFYSLKSVV